MHITNKIVKKFFGYFIPLLCWLNCTAQWLFQLDDSAGLLLSQLTRIFYIILNQLRKCCKFLAYTKKKMTIKII